MKAYEVIVDGEVIFATVDEWPGEGRQRRSGTSTATWQRTASKWFRRNWANSFRCATG